MFKRLEDITDIFDNTDPAMPGGKAKDDPTGDSFAGTPWDAVWFNQMLGFFLAAIIDAFGSMNSASGTHDKVGQSDVLNALKTIMQRIIGEDVTPEFILHRIKTVDGTGSGLDADLLGGFPPAYYLASGIGFFVKAISGPETVIPALELDIQYNPQKQYPVFVSASGNYPGYISFSAEMLADGLHVRPARLEDGKLVYGTPMRKWGISKWGEGGQFLPGKKWGEGKWGDDKWSASRRIGGVAWGTYAPMYINIIIKELS
jgi:hypothetical protein